MQCIGFLTSFIQSRRRRGADVNRAGFSEFRHRRGIDKLNSVLDAQFLEGPSHTLVRVICHKHAQRFSLAYSLHDLLHARYVRRLRQCCQCHLRHAPQAFCPYLRPSSTYNIIRKNKCQPLFLLVFPCTRVRVCHKFKKSLKQRHFRKIRSKIYNENRSTISIFFSCYVRLFHVKHFAAFSKKVFAIVPIAQTKRPRRHRTRSFVVNTILGKIFQNFFHRFRHMLFREAELLEQRAARRGCAEAFHRHCRAVETHVSFPSE